LTPQAANDLAIRRSHRSLHAGELIFNGYQALVKAFTGQ
jgi:hypothetical protein